MLAGVSAGWAGKRAAAPFPAPLSPLEARFLRCAPDSSGQIFLDEAEHFLHNRSASVATLRQLFAFGPECRSRSLRNQCSPSPESSLFVELSLKTSERHRATRIPVASAQS